MAIQTPEEGDTAAIRAQIRAGQAEEAVAVLEGLSPEELVTAVRAWRGVAGRLYREEKDLDAFTALSEALIARLERALAGATGEARLLIAPPLCGTCYNLASFAWVGWDEAGIHVGPYAIAAGRRAAQRSLEVRHDSAHAGARFGVTPEMAWWVIGAQALAVGDFAAAREAFATAAQAARDAGEPDRLERGYLALTDHLAAPFDTDAVARFASVVAEYDPQPGVEPGEHDAFFQGQLRTARRVFLGGEATDGV